MNATDIMDLYQYSISSKNYCGDSVTLTSSQTGAKSKCTDSPPNYATLCSGDNLSLTNSTIIQKYSLKNK